MHMSMMNIWIMWMHMRVGRMCMWMGVRFRYSDAERVCVLVVFIVCMAMGVLKGSMLMTMAMSLG